MKRVEHWANSLVDVLAFHMGAPFEYGVSDCFIMAMDSVLALTTEDPYGEYRGKYTTAQGYYKCLKQRGFNDLTDALTAILPEIAPSMAQRGDILVMETDDGPCLGVMVGGGCLFKTEIGARFHPLSSVTAAWHVG